MGENNGNRHQHAVIDADGTTLFRAKEYSSVHTMISLFILYCTFQIPFLLILSLFVLPMRHAAAVFGLLVFLVVIPLNENISLGQKLSRYLAKHACGYFPMSLHVEDIKAFDPNQSYVFGYEPHSILPFGVLALASHVGFMPTPKIKLLVTSNFCSIAIVRHIWTWMGCIPATKKHFCSYLTSGYSCIVIPGGVREISYLEQDPNSEVAYVKSRKGFVRIAIEIGRPIVPVFCFGQKFGYKWRKLTKKGLFEYGKIKFPTAIYWGRFGSLFPFRQPMHVVVGKPVFVEKNENPSMDEIDKVNAQFVTALQELVEKYKDKVGYPDLHLEVI